MGAKPPCWTSRLILPLPSLMYMLIGSSFSLIVIVGVVVPIDSLNVAVMLTSSAFLMRLSLSLSVKVTVSGDIHEYDPDAVPVLLFPLESVMEDPTPSFSL